MKVYLAAGQKPNHTWAKLEDDGLTAVNAQGEEVSLVAFETEPPFALGKCALDVSRPYHYPYTNEHAIAMYMYIRSLNENEQPTWEWICKANSRNTLPSYGTPGYQDYKRQLKEKYNKILEMEFFDADNNELLTYAQKSAAAMVWSTGLELISLVGSSRYVGFGSKDPTYGKTLREAEREVAEHIGEDGFVTLSLVLFIQHIRRKSPHPTTPGV